IYFKYLFNKEGDYKKKNIIAILLKLNSPKNNSDLGIRAYKKESQYVGFFANAVIFVSIATVINLELLWQYKTEILYVFILTTVIRYLIMLSFIKYKKYPMRWSNILTLAGMKGGLAVIMIVSLDDNFIYKEMFLTITLGVVILSIFVYTIFLMIYLSIQKDNLRLDEAGEHNIKDIKDIKDLLKKEINTEAYNEIIFEELVEKEITRAQRYKQVFSIISFKLDGVDIKPFKDKMRKSDSLGKITSEDYAILLPRTSLDDIIKYIEKLEKFLGDKHISVVQYSAGDSRDMLYEKLLSGLKYKNNLRIEV
ncbi:MAG: cation:proton antiporter, partial [Campylobacterota bacterium]|nr:cation:proton antiporter [Campylobacterota bacterium]